MDNDALEIFAKEIEMVHQINEIFNGNHVNISDRIFIFVKILASYAKRSNNEISMLNAIIEKLEEIKTNREIDVGYMELFINEGQLQERLDRKV